MSDHLMSLRSILPLRLRFDCCFHQLIATYQTGPGATVKATRAFRKEKAKRVHFYQTAVSQKVTVWFKSIVKINCKFFLWVCTSTRGLVFVSELWLRPAVERLPLLSCFTRWSTRENLQLCSASAQAVSVGTRGDSDHLCWQTTKTVRDDLY